MHHINSSETNQQSSGSRRPASPSTHPQTSPSRSLINHVTSVTSSASSPVPVSPASASSHGSRQQSRTSSFSSASGARSSNSSGDAGSGKLRKMLILDDNNRQRLQEIRDSLSHLRVSAAETEKRQREPLMPRAAGVNAHMVQQAMTAESNQEAVSSPHPQDTPTPTPQHMAPLYEASSDAENSITPQPITTAANTPVPDASGNIRGHHRALADIKQSLQTVPQTPLSADEAKQLLIERMVDVGCPREIAEAALLSAPGKLEDAIDVLRTAWPKTNGITQPSAHHRGSAPPSPRPGSAIPMFPAGMPPQYPEHSTSESGSIRSESPSTRSDVPPPLPPRSMGVEVASPPPLPPRQTPNMPEHLHARMMRMSPAPRGQTLRANSITPGHIHMPVKGRPIKSRCTPVQIGPARAASVTPLTNSHRVDPQLTAAASLTSLTPAPVSGLHSVSQSSLHRAVSQNAIHQQPMHATGIERRTPVDTLNDVAHKPPAPPPPYSTAHVTQSLPPRPPSAAESVNSLASDLSNPFVGNRGMSGISSPTPPLPPRAIPAHGSKAGPVVMQPVRSREVPRPQVQHAAPVSQRRTTASPGPYTATPISTGHGYHTPPHKKPMDVQIEILKGKPNSEINISAHQMQSAHVSSQPTIEIRRPPPYGQMAGGQNSRVCVRIPKSAGPGGTIHITNQRIAIESNARVPASPLLTPSPMSTPTAFSSPPSSLSDERPPPPYHVAPSPMPDVERAPPPYPIGAASLNPTAAEGEKKRCTSPKPERRPGAEKRDQERRETKIKHYSPEAYKFFMEQHMEGLIRQRQDRDRRKHQLEQEMSKVELNHEAKNQMRQMLIQKESNYMRLKRAKMDPSAYEKLATLGKGAFGEVELVKKRDTNQLYAMKTLRKSDVLRRNQVAHVKAERDILAEADSEWVVKLYYSFQDQNHLYFVMDYVPGGDLMSLLIKKEVFEERLARFYIAELVLAIDSVHKLGFIHRDIKPDNILIDKDGHIKLTDFGLCTGFRWTHNSKYYQKGHERQSSFEWEDGCHGNCTCRPLKPLERRAHHKGKRCLAHSLVGTPNYIAPEVLQRSGYDKSCDWWSVGVILYEMLVGQPPFFAESPVETQRKVINWQQSLCVPDEAHLLAPAKDLILQLCRSPEDRLGCEKGAEDIRGHPFFNPIRNWDTLRSTEAPYIPLIKGPTDTSNFDEVPEKALDDEKTRDHSLHRTDYPFLEFTFRRFFDREGNMVAPKMHSSSNASNDPDSAVFV